LTKRSETERNLSLASSVKVKNNLHSYLDLHETVNIKVLKQYKSFIITHIEYLDLLKKLKFGSTKQLTVFHEIC